MKAELTDGMTDKFMFTKLLPDSEKHLKISLADLDKAVTILDETDALLAKANLKFYEDDVIYLEFIVDLYRSLVQEKIQLVYRDQSYSACL